MSCTCIIPARGGSTRIPFKNVKDFNGQPIMAYSIQAAARSKLFERIIVSTDSAMIAAVARAHGVEAVRRPESLAQDEVGTQEVIKDVIEYHGVQTDDVCCIYATAPLLTMGQLLREYAAFINDDKPYRYLDGWFYFGTREAFVSGVPLTEGYSIPHPTHWVDINDMDDWNRALELKKLEVL